MMANGNRKEFLNTGILGGGAGVAEKRAFRAVRTEYLTSPDYDPKYFETFPTSWAAGYAFRKVLDLPIKPGGEAGLVSEEVSSAVEEWVTLFLLHYFGVAYLKEFRQTEIQQDYDRDLWLALSGTYPSSREEPPKSIKLLQHDETVLGAYYPAVIFFPARDRTTWIKDNTLADYVIDNRLSWTRSRRILLASEKEERDFHSHLRLIAKHAVPDRKLQDRLYEFCESNFTERLEVVGGLDVDPLKWEVPGLKDWSKNSDELLEMYPLQKAKMSPQGDTEGSLGRRFYLLDGLPELQPWMKAALVPSGPAPYQYHRSKNKDREIVCDLPGRRFLCPIDENDEIILLKDLFLADTPHWCKIPKSSDTVAAHIRSIHKMELRDPVITEKDTAVCLAPIKSEFIRHFPEILTNLAKISASPSLEGASVEWTIPVMPGREVKWQTRPSYSKGLAASSLAMWPPSASSEWRLYAAYGIGTKEDCGRWNLIDQTGKAGEIVEIEAEEYVSVLAGSDVPNQPRALMLSDNSDRERGILFLAELGGDQTSSLKAELAIDFGTSNTCLAYRFSDSQPETLRFTLTPRPLWGKRGDTDTALELPGFFPYKWSATTNKGFFPTTLLSRRSGSRLTDDLSPEAVTLGDLFKIDIPGLHKRLEQPLFEGQLNSTWKHHTNLKWDLESSGRIGPWRELFLELTLLYAHAELFFSRRSLVTGYVFTFPLAFKKPDRESYHSKAKLALTKIRQYCYGGKATSFTYEDKVDESTAIAESIGLVGTKSTIQVFIDVGGGTADVAIAHDGGYLVLDSVMVAGNAFFQFAKRNVDAQVVGASEFRKHLGTLLTGATSGFEFPVSSQDTRLGGLDLNVAYSIFISGVEDAEFREREAAILKKGMGSYSYQRYRTRLFFRHVLAYALVQACAAVVDHKITLPPKGGGIELILGGNGWGLMLFGEFSRSAERLREEAENILDLLKQQLSVAVTDEERPCLESLKIAQKLHLLNEEDLSKAKTNVAKGALNAARSMKVGDRNTAMPYTGISFEQIRLRPDCSPASLRWCERWSSQVFKKLFPGVEQASGGSFRSPDDHSDPVDQLLSVFTAIGNVSNNKLDNLPSQEWININGRIESFFSSLNGNIENLQLPPINHFISEILYSRRSTRDVLDTLAETNGNYKSNSQDD
jgi:hypothetical protein